MLHQLDAVAEWVGDIVAVVADKRLILDDGATGGSQSGDECSQIRHKKGRVRARRREILLHAEMHLDVILLEPAAAAGGKMSRFRHLQKPEQIPVKATRLIFAAFRHGELPMVDGEQAHAAHVTLGWAAISSMQMI
jgi:hypothetical protein